MKTASCQPEKVSSRRLYFYSFARGLTKVSGVELPSMSKLFRRKGFRLASVAYFLSLGTLAVALFAWFSTSSTFSWFASNKTVDATGMAIKVKADEDVDIEMHVYKYTSTSGSTVEETTDLSLSRYDRVFQEDNDYAPVLLKLELTGGAYSDDESLPLKLLRGFDESSSTTLETADNTLITYGEGENEKTKTYDTDGVASSSHGLSSYISSVISVKAFVETKSATIAWNDSDLKTSFESAREQVFEPKEENAEIKYVEKRFVTAVKGFNSATETLKSKEIDFSDVLKYNEVSDGTCIVYVWIDYDETQSVYSNDGYYGLINAYIDQMNDGTTGINTSYPLDSDIYKLTIIKQQTAASQ